MAFVWGNVSLDDAKHRIFGQGVFETSTHQPEMADEGVKGESKTR